ncbi:hypothetical protein Ciccas_013872 [Cichlidogyrus casuarinus]|uniref:Uncharacterized protein n=1 Tax=Cichlidogyrus casuarinus TaxID=1844966 RepID=A0ABD2PPF7_9PLAT
MSDSASFTVEPSTIGSLFAPQSTVEEYRFEQNLSSSRVPFSYPGYSSEFSSQRLKLEDVFAASGSSISGGLAQFRHFANPEEYHDNRLQSQSNQTAAEPAKTKSDKLPEEAVVKKEKVDDPCDSMTPLTRGYRCKMCKQVGFRVRSYFAPDVSH